MNRRNKVPPHHLPSSYTQQLSPCRAVVGQSLVPPGTYQLQGVPSALSITGGRGHQELNGILYTLCWSNLPVNTFWVPPSRLLTGKQDPLRATVWSRTAWMQRLTAGRVLAVSQGRQRYVWPRPPWGCRGQLPSSHALPWAQGPSTFWDMLLLLTQGAALQLVPPMLWPRAVWSQISSSKTTNFSHETSNTENLKWVFGQYLL